MDILIFGAGAIGQWLGALLASSGCRVQLHGRPRVAEAIAKQGGISLNGEPPQHVSFSTELDELKGRQFSSVVCTVKTYAVRSALEELRSIKPAFEHLVSFQNGWGTEAAYTENFPHHKLWTLTTTRAVGVEGPGQLAPSPKGGLAIAPWRQGDNISSPVEFRKVPIALVQPNRGIDLKWSKLLLNIIGNATGAITGLSPNALAERPKLMKMELLLVREAMAVGKALGVERVDLPGFPIKLISNMIEKLPVPMVAPLVAAKMRRARGDKLPSLFFDLENPTAPSEIDDLNGAVVREGNRLGVSTPHQTLLLEAFSRCRTEPTFWERVRNTPDRLADILGARVGLETP